MEFGWEVTRLRMGSRVAACKRLVCKGKHRCMGLVGRGRFRLRGNCMLRRKCAAEICNLVSMLKCVVDDAMPFLSY